MLLTAARGDPRYGSAARTAVFLTVTAVAMTLLLGRFTHGEPRFLFMPMMALLWREAKVSPLCSAFSRTGCGKSWPRR